MLLHLETLGLKESRREPKECVLLLPEVEGWVFFDILPLSSC